MGLINININTNLQLYETELSFLRQIKANELTPEDVLEELIEIEKLIQNNSDNTNFLIRLSSFIQSQTGL